MSPTASARAMAVTWGIILTVVLVSVVLKLT